MDETKKDLNSKEVKEEKKETLDDLLEGGQSANKIVSPASADKDAKKGSEAKPEGGEKTPEELAKEKPNVDDKTKKEVKEEKGDELLLGKFKTVDDLGKSYKEAENKIREQADEIIEMKSEAESNQSFFEALGKVFEKHPEVQKQLQDFLKEVVEGKTPGKEDKGEEIGAIVEKKLQDRENKRLEDEAKKAEMDKINVFIDAHPDVREEDEKLGLAIMDYLDENKFPITAKSFELAYKELSGKPAKTEKELEEEAEKRIEAKKTEDLEREEAANGLKGGDGGGKTPKKGETLNDILSGGKNVNKV